MTNRFKLSIDGKDIGILDGSATECAAYIETISKHNSVHKATQGCRFNTTSNGSVFISAKQLATSVIVAEPV